MSMSLGPPYKRCGTLCLGNPYRVLDLGIYVYGLQELIANKDLHRPRVLR